ncbi:MAG: hypothetical protein HKN26_09235, partial [Acidimicrobiales bacterium]|nr:hypothetical protein [Acidimicrobiales bacterium]
PLVVAAALLVLVGVVVGSLVVGSLRGIPRIALVLVLGAAGGVALHLPGSIAFLHNGVQWAPIGGSGRTGPGDITLLELLRFDTGPFTSTWLPFALLAPAVFALLLGRGWRLVWAVRGWFVTVAGWAVAWADQWGALDVALPAPEVPLAVAGFGLALASAMAVPAFEHDLGRHRFGWRQIGAGVALAGVLLGGVPLVVAAVDGGWNAPERGFANEYRELFAADDVPYRVLWLGDAELLPVASWDIDAHSSFGLTENGGPTGRDQVLAPLDNDTRRVLSAVQRATDGRSGRLGEALAPMGVRYVVLVEANAPAPFATRSSAESPATGQLRSGLAQQLDLVRIEGINRSVRLYRNDAFIAARATVPPGSDDTPNPADTEPVLTNTEHPNRFTGPFSPGADVHMATAADHRWRLTVDGQTSVRTEGFGWANRFTPTVQGDAELFYRTPATRRAALIGQLVAWAFVISVFWLRRVPRPKAAKRMARAGAKR